jgi:hypothetical protein
VYGGEDTSGYPSPYHVWSYDILFDRWDDNGSPNIAVAPNIASYGAGVGVAQTGTGYYYGGWIKNTTMRGYTGSPKMSGDLYKYDYDANEFSSLNPPDQLGRSEGAMVWLEAGDNPGLLVYFGGLVDTFGNGTSDPQPMDKILVYDPATNAWFTQTAVGHIPQNRSRFCADVAWAPDKSSYNMWVVQFRNVKLQMRLINSVSYLWGGLSQPPGSTNVSAFNDVYVLSLPTFTWAKIFPGHGDNSTYQYGHYSATCNMVKSQSQMFVIGGTYPNPGDEDTCDLAADIYAQHNIWTGGVNNTGNPPQDIYWAVYNPNVTSNVVPVDVYSIVGGTKNGGATQLTPKGGYDSGIPGTGLGALLARKGPTTTRSATREVQTSSPTQSASPTHTSSPSSHGLSKGAIAGIAIAGVIALAVLAFVWFVLSKRIRRRREARRNSQMMQVSGYPGGHGIAPGYAATPVPVPYPSHNPGSWGPPPAEMGSAQDKAYADARMSPMSAKHDSQVYYPPPVEVPGMGPVEMAQTRSPPPQTATPSTTHAPSPVAPGASPNFTHVADHNWQTYHAPPTA